MGAGRFNDNHKLMKKLLKELKLEKDMIKITVIQIFYQRKIIIYLINLKIKVLLLH